MTSQTATRLHWSFWLICAIGLLWNIGGAANYLMQSDEQFVSALPATHQAIIVERPIWATGGFAVGVFGGALGCLLLLLRWRSALYILTLSLAGIIITMLHTLNVALSKIEFSTSEIMVMVIMPVAVALGLLLFAKTVIAKNEARFNSAS